MADKLTFDDRLLNKYTVEDLAQSHAPLHTALTSWFSAFGDFDDDALGRLIAARSPQDIERCKPKGEAALATIPALVASLDVVIAALERALSGDAAFPEREQIESLLASARSNRATLAEQAPALVAKVLGAVGSYDDARASAAKAVEHAAAQLEAMRARSRDASLRYSDMQPMVAELQACWRSLDAALEPLSREHKKEARAPHEAKMRSTARELCRNMFARKMEARASGAWPQPVIASTGDSAAERFGVALARGDYAAATAECAPWVASTWTSAQLESRMREETRIIARDLELDATPPAANVTVSDNPMRYEHVQQDESLRRDVAPDVTAENYKGWLRLTIRTDDEDAYLTDVDTLASLSVIAVGTPQGDRIGFVRFEE